MINKAFFISFLIIIIAIIELFSLICLLNQYNKDGSKYTLSIGFIHQFRRIHATRWSDEKMCSKMFFLLHPLATSDDDDNNISHHHHHHHQFYSDSSNKFARGKKERDKILAKLGRDKIENEKQC